MSISNLLRISPALFTILFATSLLADANKFKINGDTLVYDTSLAEAKEDQEINWDDAVALEELFTQKLRYQSPAFRELWRLNWRQRNILPMLLLIMN